MFAASKALNRLFQKSEGCVVRAKFRDGFKLFLAMAFNMSAATMILHFPGGRC